MFDEFSMQDFFSVERDQQQEAERKVRFANLQELLPQEVWLRSFSWLDAGSLYQVLTTCRYYFDALQAEQKFMKQIQATPRTFGDIIGRAAAIPKSKLFQPQTASSSSSFDREERDAYYGGSGESEVHQERCVEFCLDGTYYELERETERSTDHRQYHGDEPECDTSWNPVQHKVDIGWYTVIHVPLSYSATEELLDEGACYFLPEASKPKILNELKQLRRWEGWAEIGDEGANRTAKFVITKSYQFYAETERITAECPIRGVPKKKTVAQKLYHDDPISTFRGGGLGWRINVYRIEEKEPRSGKKCHNVLVGTGIWNISKRDVSPKQPYIVDGFRELTEEEKKKLPSPEERLKQSLSKQATAQNTQQQPKQSGNKRKKNGRPKSKE